MSVKTPIPAPPVQLSDLKILNDFLVRNGVDYVLTGTAALYIHGALPSNHVIHDIDIIALTNDSNRETLMALFHDLEHLSGCEYCEEHYKHRVYIFKIDQNNIKVNVFEGKVEDTPFQIMCLDEIGNILVHNVDAILQAKFSLSRPKDYAFFHKYIAWLSNMNLDSRMSDIQ